jgi:4-hydroxybenzoate polyprenyltransferase
MKIISYLIILITYSYFLLNNLVDCLYTKNLKNNNLKYNNLILNKINKKNSLVTLNSNLKSNLNSNIKFVNNKNIFKNKLIGYLKLIRYKNIFPTIYLFLTGAFIVNPDINNLLLQSKTLFYSLTSTLCILMSNMVINDLFDMKLDKINNSLRPLITGDITIKEANILLITLLSITEYINIYFLPKNLQKIIHLSLLYTFIYTPILKRIPLIKNLSCALIVSTSVYVGGLAASISKNINLLYQIISLVFLGSLYNEILLDIRDHEGDLQHNIYTVSILFGKRIALSISKFILTVNINLNTLLILALGYPYYSFLFFLLCMPILNDLFKVYQNYNNKNNIINAVTTSSKQLLFMLVLICLLSLKF